MVSKKIEPKNFPGLSNIAIFSHSGNAKWVRVFHLTIYVTGVTIARTEVTKLYQQTSARLVLEVDGGVLMDIVCHPQVYAMVSFILLKRIIKNGRMRKF